MTVISRLIIGLVLILFGLVMVGISFTNLSTLIYGIPALILGIVILLNKGEDKIEGRKDKK